MISLQPREQFMILRKLGDHTDATTYYVRAVIRNSVTGEIIDTLNLTDAGSGSRRFYKLYEIPADVSGQGFYIDIETTVYSDSGYSSKAAAYTEELEQYLVFDRMPKGGGGGGADVDYKKIAKILTETLKPLTDRKEIDLGPVLLQIKGVFKAIDAIDIPKPEKLDNTPVIKLIADTGKKVLEAIEKKPVTPVTELGGLEKNLREAITAKEPNLEKVYAGFKALEKMISEYITEYTSREGAKEKLEEIKNALGPVFQGENFKPTPIKKGKDPRIMRLLGKDETDE